MKVYWIVAYTKGLNVVKNPDVDIFETYELAAEEAKNRGYGWSPMILNKNETIDQISRQNRALRKENEVLRRALEKNKE